MLGVMVFAFASTWTMQIVTNDSQNEEIALIKASKADIAYVAAEIEKIKIEEGHREQLLISLNKGVKELTKSTQEINIKLAKMGK